MISYSHQKVKWNEYYTTKEEVEFIFNDVIITDYLKDKVIYCPCDGDNSEFVKYLKSHKDDIKYKQFIYTSDDYHTHEDIFKNVDIVITNPPFEGKVFSDLVDLIKKYDCKCFLFNSVSKSDFGKKYDLKVQVALNKFHFNNPEIMRNTGDYTSFVRHIYLYDIPCKIAYAAPEFKLYFKDIEPVYNIRKDGTQILNVDRINKTPQDYAEPMLLPVTVYQEHNAQFFDFLDLDEYEKGTGFSDGKGRFKRVLVKWKEKYLKTNDKL